MMGVADYHSLFKLKIMDVEEYVRLIESCITYEQLVNLKDRVESYRFVPEKDYNRLMQLIDTQSDKIAKDD